jgi:membrane protein YdbS with pleckstrin-like domain
MFIAGLIIVLACAVLLFFVGQRQFWVSLSVLAAIGIIMIAASRVRPLR